ncbi:DUF1513 domain-containing protein [Rhodovulum euryhalinum]|uniref:Secreted protein n=1 Tax=Rhodovulum euryhalinum TaxID=35805 RepID=A0A4R2KQV6_9RHOB|nr:DUF1513 domain-containing protein [Rhodovulum euryhalinum]TCO73336.1 hypothetical protein EV655_102100 [Rhodovulum euryhalinum]
MTSRRGFLAGLLAAGVVPKPGWADAGDPAYLTAARLPDRSYWLFGLTETGDELFRLPLPDRGHAAAAHPARPEAVAFARRPGTFAVVIDCVTGASKAVLESPPGRHFYGHGAFSADGGLLFAPENDYKAARGVIGIWDAARGYARLGEFSSGGVGPHDARLLPDGETIVVANGGIETHPEAGRTKLNLSTMRPNLTYLRLDGTAVDQTELDPALHRNSIRHLAVGPDGLVAFAMQWEGDLAAHPPLLGLHRMGGTPRLLAAGDEDHRRMQGYAGSIALAPASGQVAITSPRGGLVQMFDTVTGTCLASHAGPDVCGVSDAGRGFLITAGTGIVSLAGAQGEIWRRRHACQWDNHLVRVARG